MNKPIVFAAFAIQFAFLGYLASKPARELKGKVPDLAGETNWGMLTQSGRKIVIDGHERWWATGFIREDGKVQLQWIHRDDSRPAPAVYEVEGAGRLVGRWGWLGSCEVNEAGELDGETFADVTYRLSGPEQ